MPPHDVDHLGTREQRWAIGEHEGAGVCCDCQELEQVGVKRRPCGLQRSASLGRTESLLTRGDHGAYVGLRDDDTLWRAGGTGCEDEVSRVAGRRQLRRTGCVRGMGFERIQQHHVVSGQINGGRSLGKHSNVAQRSDTGGQTR